MTHFAPSDSPLVPSLVETVQHALTGQFAAALSTLNACFDRCPDGAWNAPIGNLALCQVAFHTLFFTDLYLEFGEDSFREQPFHLEHAAAFRDYEELLPKRQQHLYERSFIRQYLRHCRDKSSQVIAAETPAELCGPSGFTRLELSRIELHLYSIRHVQHHAAQLSLRLRLDVQEEVPWFGSGWRES